MRNCNECPFGHWPNHDHSDCRLIEASHLLWHETWAILIVSLSSFGAILAALTCALFLKYRETAIVRASSEQLCHVLLLGIAMSYVTPIGFVVKPSKISCNLLPFMFGICFVTIVGKSQTSGPQRVSSACAFCFSRRQTTWWIGHNFVEV